MYVRAAGTSATYWSGNCEVGIVRADNLVIDGQQVVGSRLGPIPGPGGGATIDAQARASIDAILSALRTHGVIISQ